MKDRKLRRELGLKIRDSRSVGDDKKSDKKGLFRIPYQARKNRGNNILLSSNSTSNFRFDVKTILKNRTRLPNQFPDQVVSHIDTSVENR